MLVHAVIVTSNGTGAYINIASDIAVANVAEMIGLAALADIAGFHFHKIANMDFFGKGGSWTKASVGSYPAICADLGVVEVAKRFNTGTGGDIHVAQNAIRPYPYPVGKNDINAVASIVTFTAMLVLFAGFLADIVLAALDPRVRTS